MSGYGIPGCRKFGETPGTPFVHLSGQPVFSNRSLIDPRPTPRSEGLDRFDSVAHRYCDRVDDISVIAEYEPVPVSTSARHFRR